MAEKREQFLKTYFSSLGGITLIGETAAGSGVFKYKAENQKGNQVYLFVYDQYIDPPADTIPDKKARKAKEPKKKAAAKPKGRSGKKQDDEDEDDEDEKVPELNDEFDFDEEEDQDDDGDDDIGVAESKQSDPPPSDLRLEYDPVTGMIKDGQIHEMICSAFGSIVRRFKNHVKKLGPGDAAIFDRIIRIWKEICDDSGNEPRIPPSAARTAELRSSAVLPLSSSRKLTKEEQRKAVDKFAIDFLRENKDQSDDDFKIGKGARDSEDEDEDDEDEDERADDEEDEMQFGGGGDDEFYDSEFEDIFKSDGSVYSDDAY